MKKFKFIDQPKINIKYPNIKSVYNDENDVDADFFSYKGGVDVGDHKVQEWVNECVHGLLDNPETHYYYISGGNTLVVAVLNKEDGEINVFVSKSHMEAVVPLYKDTYVGGDES